MKQKGNVRDEFLNDCKNSQAEMNFIMRTGFQHHGRVVDFDDDVIIAEVNRVNKMLYQMAISTIEPYVQHYAARQHYTGASWASPPREFLRDR